MARPTPEEARLIFQAGFTLKPGASVNHPVFAKNSRRLLKQTEVWVTANWLNQKLQHQRAYRHLDQALARPLFEIAPEEL